MNKDTYKKYFVDVIQTSYQSVETFSHFQKIIHDLYSNGNSEWYESFFDSDFSDPSSITNWSYISILFHTIAKLK